MRRRLPKGEGSPSGPGDDAAVRVPATQRQPLPTSGVQALRAVVGVVQVVTRDGRGEVAMALGGAEQARKGRKG